MNRALRSLSPALRERLRRRSRPRWTAPMLATLTDERFSSDEWIYERKLDGERALAFRAKKRVRLRSRNKKSLAATYPEIVDALRDQPCDDFIVDGEIVAFEGGRTSFSRLQGRMQIKNAEEARQSGIRVYYYLFDLLHLDGHDTSRLPLESRKQLLRRAFEFEDPLRFTPHRRGNGVAYWKAACRKGWEGVIAKRGDSPYVHSRSRKWLKFKCVKDQEFVIGGFTEPRGSRKGFGALLVGTYAGGSLRYAGKVGTGYDEETLVRLRKRLGRLEQERRPFAGGDLPSRGVRWVKPRLVAQVGFTEWTRDGRLRHPRFLGLRRDKNPRSVRRERG